MRYLKKDFQVIENTKHLNELMNERNIMLLGKPQDPQVFFACISNMIL